MLRGLAVIIGMLDMVFKGAGQGRAADSGRPGGRARAAGLKGW
ncbi:MAG: hypothetical protein PHD17_00755 [Methanothrix soehngenii]|nr:hypothetical protein [Methanothrix soehngenii]